jgi:hypothetical protein
LWLGQANAKQIFVLLQPNPVRNFYWKRALRRFAEYVVTIGTALLCSYWILQGR